MEELTRRLIMDQDTTEIIQYDNNWRSPEAIIRLASYKYKQSKENVKLAQIKTQNTKTHH